MIIGLIGKAQAGKSTVATYLVQEHGFVRYAFAEPLKQMLISAGMITHDEAYATKTQQSRWLMQKVGTDIFRKQVDPEYWTKLAAKEILRLASAGHNVVIDDIRFPEEAEVIAKKFRGLLVKVVREGHTDQHAGAEHESERYIEALHSDYIISAESGDTGALLTMIEGIVTAQRRGR